MLPRSPTLRSSLLRLHRTVIDIADIAASVSREPELSELEQAVIVLEDRRFFAHAGFDLRSIAREIVRAATFRRFGGASTIDIQLFRTMSNRYERTLRRKIREAIGAWVMQRKLSKIAILRSYMEVAYFGTGLKGAEAASYAVFEKSCTELDRDEALEVAAMLVYPKPRLANADWRAKIRRRARYGGSILGSGKKRLNQIGG